MAGRTNFRSASIAAALGIAALGLTACSSDKAAAPRPCPEVRIPAEAANLTRFRPGPGRAIIDVLHQETVTGFGHVCEYDTDDTGAGTLRVLVAPTIVAERGPADTARKADFVYFLAVTDSRKNLLNKARFPIAIPFPDNFTRVQWQPEEPHAINIPITAGQTGDDFNIYIGLQLSPEDLEYNSQKR